MPNSTTPSTTSSQKQQLEKSHQSVSTSLWPFSNLFGTLFEFYHHVRNFKRGRRSGNTRPTRESAPNTSDQNPEESSTQQLNLLHDQSIPQQWLTAMVLDSLTQCHANHSSPSSPSSPDSHPMATTSSAADHSFIFLLRNYVKEQQEFHRKELAYSSHSLRRILYVFLRFIRLAIWTLSTYKYQLKSHSQSLQNYQQMQSYQNSHQEAFCDIMGDIRDRIEVVKSVSAFKMHNRKMNDMDASEEDHSSVGGSSTTGAQDELLDTSNLDSAHAPESGSQRADDHAAAVTDSLMSTTSSRSTLDSSPSHYHQQQHKSPRHHPHHQLTVSEPSDDGVGQRARSSSHSTSSLYSTEGEHHASHQPPLQQDSSPRRQSISNQIQEFEAQTSQCNEELQSILQLLESVSQDYPEDVYQIAIQSTMRQVQAHITSNQIQEKYIVSMLEKEFYAQLEFNTASPLTKQRRRTSAPAQNRKSSESRSSSSRRRTMHATPSNKVSSLFSKSNSAAKSASRRRSFGIDVLNRFKTFGTP